MTLSSAHHDGSALYVENHPIGPGDEVTVRLRVPAPSRAESVALRYVHDGEPGFVRAEVDERNAHETWWLARFPALNLSTRYRWLISGGSQNYAWVNGLGVHRRDVADADDFAITHDPGGPDWHLKSVVYEIFPDRFATRAYTLRPRRGQSQDRGTPFQRDGVRRPHTSGLPATCAVLSST